MAYIGNKITPHFLQVMLQRHIHDQQANGSIIDHLHPNTISLAVVILRPCHKFDGFMQIDTGVKVILKLRCNDHIIDLLRHQVFTQISRCHGVGHDNFLRLIKQHKTIIKHFAQCNGDLMVMS